MQFKTRVTLSAVTAGKTISRIPKVGGLFSPEQLPQSDAWPALKFMIDQARRFCALIARSNSRFIYAESGLEHDLYVSDALRARARPPPVLSKFHCVDHSFFVTTASFLLYFCCFVSSHRLCFVVVRSARVKVDCAPAGWDWRTKC
jgi:hypothetical protein